MKKHSFKDWMIAVRPWSFPASAMPVVVTLAYLFWMKEDINWANGIWALLNIVVFHAAGNTWSDYFDYKQGVDMKDTFGAKTLTDKMFTPKEIYRLSLVLLLAALAGGLGLLWRTGFPLLYIGLGGCRVLAVGRSGSFSRASCGRCGVRASVSAAEVQRVGRRRYLHGLRFLAHFGDCLCLYRSISVGRSVDSDSRRVDYGGHPARQQYPRYADRRPGEHQDFGNGIGWKDIRDSLLRGDTVPFRLDCRLRSSRNFSFMDVVSLACAGSCRRQCPGHVPVFGKGCCRHRQSG